MSIFKTEMLSRPVRGHDGSAAMSRRPRRYGVSPALKAKPVLAYVECIELLALVNDDELKALHRVA